MTLYGISQGWNKAAYQALLGAAELRGDYCVLVQRRWASDTSLEWIETRSVDLESKRRTMQWPGTIVYDDADAATLLKYRITPELVRALRDSADSPFGWLGPDLPEDLSFLRADGRPWFISIAHEGDAFFKLMADEVEPLRAQLGVIRLVEQGKDQMPGERY